MAHRIDLILRTECLSEAVRRRGEHQQRIAHLFLARRVPVRHLELAGAVLADLDGVLQRVHLLDVLRIRRVDQRTHCRGDVARPDLILRQGITALAVDDHRHVVVLADDLHRHETLARIGQRDRHRTSFEVEYRRRIKRIAVQPDNGLVVDPRRLAAMAELAEGATTVLDEGSEIQIALGTREVVDGDRHRLAALCSRNHCEERECDQ